MNHRTSRHPRSLGLLAVSMAAGLSACATEPSPQEAPPLIGMANPASVYCIEQGGKIEMLKGEDGGEYGMCHLPDGTEIEEWTLFYRDHPRQGSVAR